MNGDLVSTRYVLNETNYVMKDRISYNSKLAVCRIQKHTPDYPPARLSFFSLVIKLNYDSGFRVYMWWVRILANFFLRYVSVGRKRIFEVMKFDGGGAGRE